MFKNKSISDSVKHLSRKYKIKVDYSNYTFVISNSFLRDLREELYACDLIKGFDWDLWTINENIEWYVMDFFSTFLEQVAPVKKQLQEEFGEDWVNNLPSNFEKFKMRDPIAYLFMRFREGWENLNKMEQK